MSYITNIDTLSALLDRLISENIKLHFFRKEDVVDDIEHQENLIEEIKYRITQLLLDTYNERQYKYISEKRTYKPEDIVETLEELIHNDITTGEGDRANLKEATSDNPSLEHFTRNHKLIRKANENRAVAKNKLDKQFKGKNRFKSSIQVQDIGILQWLLIPRLIFLYNILINRKKNRTFVNLKAIHLLPSKIIELTISTPDGFTFTPGDYVYVNCSQISKMEWYPFNIIRHTNDGNLILHVKSNNRWTTKLYRETVEGLTQNDELNWDLRIDGPYGSSSNKILQSEHAILVGAGHGISRIAPILQDIAMRSKKDPDNIKLKRIDLFWLSSDDHYFEWFTKLLHEINFADADTFFHYHIYFVDKQPENMKEKMMYISTNILDKETDVILIDNLWGKSSFGNPDWSTELRELQSQNESRKSRLFFSGPRNMKGNIQSECTKLNISYHEGDF